MKSVQISYCFSSLCVVAHRNKIIYKVYKFKKDKFMNFDCDLMNHNWWFIIYFLGIYLKVKYHIDLGLSARLL